MTYVARLPLLLKFSSEVAILRRLQVISVIVLAPTPWLGFCILRQRFTSGTVFISAFCAYLIPGGVSG
jgi:hypothetical protein